MEMPFEAKVPLFKDPYGKCRFEASICMKLDLSVRENADLINEIETKIMGMAGEYPQHVFRIDDDALIDQLLDTGRVVDERVKPAPTPSGSSRNRELDRTPLMKLKIKPVRRPHVTCPRLWYHSLC